MKPFDINQARSGATVTTRNGQDVIIDDYERNFYGETVIVGRIEGGIIEIWNQNGHVRHDGVSDPMDLVIK